MSTPQCIFLHSCRIAYHSGIVTTMLRTSYCQIHRSNPEYSSIEEYYERVVVIPFLNHLISELTSRFDAHAKKASMIRGLLPKRLSSRSSTADIEAVQFYKDDLPNADIIYDTSGSRDGCQFLCRTGPNPYLKH